MAAYFDSSVLLSLLLGDANASHAQALWRSELERVSSTLLDVECTTVLRRAIPARLGPAQRQELESRLSTALEEVTLKPLDEDITSLVRDTPALAVCRTLDTAHVATALFFRGGDPELPICTFDVRMAKEARELGFTVHGPDPSLHP